MEKDHSLYSVASLSHPLKSGTLPPALRSCNCPTLSAGISRLITSSKPFHPRKYFPPCASDSAFADIVRVYKFHLLTYLLI